MKLKYIPLCIFDEKESLTEISAASENTVIVNKTAYTLPDNVSLAVEPPYPILEAKRIKGEAHFSIRRTYLYKDNQPRQEWDSGEYQEIKIYETEKPEKEIMLTGKTEKELSVEKYQGELKTCEYQRRKAYQEEADGLYFDYVRGEGTLDDWKSKVEEIKLRYPKPREGL